MMPQIGNSTFGNDVYVSYVGDTNSIAMGIDSGDNTFKISSSVSTDGHAIPSTNPNIIIDPASGGNVTILPNTPGGELVLNNGSFSLPDSVGLPQGNIILGTAPFLTTGTTVSNNSMFFGADSGNSTNTGTDNTAIGASSMVSISDGISNTAIGSTTMVELSHGNNNLALGFQAGRLLASGDNNIYIANQGMTESNTMRIGTNGIQTSCYIAAIDGVDLTTLNIVTESSDQIGSATLTPGTGATITTAANAIIISAIGGGVTWNVPGGTLLTMSVNNGYISTLSSLISYILPATAAVGDMFRITLANASGSWTIVQQAGQSIQMGSSSTTVGVGGSLSSTANGDSVEIICTVANTNFIVLSSIGNLTIV
jgi:hypothetical protein